MRRVSAYFGLVRHLGIGWVMYRCGYALWKRTGALRRATPIAAWSDIPASPLSLCGVPKPETGSAASGHEMVTEAERILQGEFRLFSSRWVQAGFPPEWHRNQASGERAPADRHWSELGDFAFGDIKAVWELSRFSWAFTLGRAYAQTGDERFARGFWLLLEDWMKRNPPNLGANWMCGQEASFRLFAATFAFERLSVATETTAARRAAFARFVVATGRRIDANLSYALSQKNNHGVSECVGLITATLLLPAQAESAGWLRRAERALQRQLAELVYADGGFAQHSTNYHRVLVADLCWGGSRFRSAGEAMPTWLTEAGRKATVFLGDLLNPETGRLPLYGANDGADILPLSDSAYLDFRPAVQMGAAVFFGERWLPEGPWNEAADWLSGGEKRPARIVPRDWLPAKQWPQSGLAQLRGRESRLVLRCPQRFRHRPSQADLLHVDIEWRGVTIAHDAGTYSYNTPGPFAGALKEAAVHNSVTFSQEEPMRKISRFLYLPWPRGSMKAEGPGSVTATHDGWNRRGAAHVRTVRGAGVEGFEVVDEITCSRPEAVRLHWLLADWPHELQGESNRLILMTPKGPLAVEWTAPPEARVTLVRADPASNRGWWSPHYLEAVPALSLTIEYTTTGRLTLTTRFSPA